MFGKKAPTAKMDEAVVRSINFEVTVADLARRSDVRAIESNDASNWLEGEEASRASPAAVEPGVAQVHAPEVWALGYTAYWAFILSALQRRGIRLGV